MRRFIQPNIMDEKNLSGVYFYYSKKGVRLYTGRTHHVRDRLFAAFYGRADYATIPSKKRLRKEIYYYDAVYKALREAVRHEHLQKHKLKYNRL
jgi:hypothetical protein